MRYLLLSIAVLTSLLSTVEVAGADETNRSAADACRDLILDYAWYWDHNDPESFANLFTDDADFQAAGRVHKGRDEIYEAQLQRNPDLVTRMFFTNVRSRPADANSVHATSYLMVHSESRPKGASDDRSGTAMIPTRGFRIIGEMAFTCARTADGWKISAVDLTPVFEDINLED